MPAPPLPPPPPPEELELLAGSYILEQADERRANFAADYAAICGAAPEFAAVATYDEFCWARMVVASTPSVTNSSRAASRIAWRVSAFCRSRRASEAVRIAEVVILGQYEIHLTVSSH